jgi:UDP-N-acetylglucosamine 1-carboxyvinyltransferase
MDKIVVTGGARLSGTVETGGAKNAVLPMMAATLLASGISRIKNVPHLRDVETMAHLLRIIGARVTLENHVMTIDTSQCSYPEAPYELVKTMRASFVILGPMLARFKTAKVSLPGGCAWGPRPVDLHIRALEALGAGVDIEHGYVVARAQRLQGATFTSPISSVGATENLMMAAVLAHGTTIIENAAREPEVSALAYFLKKMGARITGEGTGRISVEGVDFLTTVEDAVIPDRIEAATFMTAAAITGGEVTVDACEPNHLASTISTLRAMGALVEVDGRAVKVSAPRPLKPVRIATAPYPGFPTDMQAQLMALACVVDGQSEITDTIYRDRFTHVMELQRLGARIALNENTAQINGVPHLSGAQVMATDLRASAALILAGLVAEGETHILRIYHLDRGYEKIEQKLAGLGAKIRREQGTL